MNKRSTAEINLDLIVPNRYRDFKRYPLDKKRIQELVESYRLNNDFGALPARKLEDGTYEIAAGHHRLEAMKKIKMKTALLIVEDYDDDQMVDIMTYENSTQAGNNPLAALDSVCAAIKRLTYWALVDEKQFCQLTNLQPTRFKERVLGNLTKGSLFSWQLLETYMGGKLGQRSIRRALDEIKNDKKLHLELIKWVQKQIEEEQAELEEEYEETKEKYEKTHIEEIKARSKGERVSEKPAKETAKKLDKLEKAKEIITTAKRNIEARHKKKDEEENEYDEEAELLKQQEREFIEALTNWLRALDNLHSSGETISYLLKQNPSLNTYLRRKTTNELVGRVGAALDTIKVLYRRLKAIVN